MPLFIMPKTQRLSDFLTNEKIVKGIVNLYTAKSLNLDAGKDYFDNELPLQLIEKDDSVDAAIITGPQADEYRDAFQHFPRNYKIPYSSDLSSFISRSLNLLSEYLKNNPGYELAFRFYLGHNGLADVKDRRYQIVIVPVCSKRDAAGVIDHSLDREASVFASTGLPFMAIALYCDKTGAKKAEISNDVNFCGNLILNKDDMPAGNPTLLVYHTFSDFNGFEAGLSTTPANPKDALKLEFGRTAAGRLTLLIEFDSLAGPIMSSFHGAAGYVFDQGDLIPPPKPVDSLFIP